MVKIKKPPGPIADQTFRMGSFVAAVVGLVAVGFLYWAELLSFHQSAFALLAVYPIYLVFAAGAVGRWVGYGADMRNLKRAEPEEQVSGYSEDTTSRFKPAIERLVSLRLSLGLIAGTLGLAVVLLLAGYETSGFGAGWLSILLTFQAFGRFGWSALESRYWNETTEDSVISSIAEIKITVTLFAGMVITTAAISGILVVAS